MKGAFFLGFALIAAGAALVALKDSGVIKELPEFFTQHATAASLILAGFIIIATQYAQYGRFKA